MRTFRIWALFIIFLTRPLPAAAWEQWETDGGKGLHWGSATISLSVNSNDFPSGSGERVALNAAGARWNADPSTLRFSFSFGTRRASTNADGTNTISFGNAGGALAVTYAWAGSDGKLKETDIVVSNRNWSTSGTIDCGAPGYNLTAVLIHELGHVAGLDHEDDVPTLMNTYYGGHTLGNVREVYPFADDLAGARAIYPIASGSSLADLATSNVRKPRSAIGAEPIVPPYSVQTGASFTLPVVLQNRGTGFAASVPVGFYLSKDFALTTNDALVATSRWLLASPGFVGQFERTISVPGDFAPGTYYAGYIIDPDRDRTDQRRSNDSSGICGVIQVRDGTPPAVSVKSPLAGNAFRRGQVIAIQWTATDNDAVERVRLSYSLGGSEGWVTVADRVFNSGRYDWVVPNDISTRTARIRVEAWDRTSAIPSQHASGLFTIDSVIPSLALHLLRDEYVGRSFDVLGFADEELRALPTMTLNTESGLARLVVKEAEQDPGQYRAALDLAPNVRATLTVESTDLVGNVWQASRDLITGTVGSAGGLALGPVALGGDHSGQFLALVRERSAGDGPAGSAAKTSFPDHWVVHPQRTLIAPIRLSWTSDATNVAIARLSDDGIWETLSCSRVGNRLETLIDHGGTYALRDESTNTPPAAAPKLATLHQNVPNPFNPSTMVSFFLSHEVDISLAIFDLKGRRVRTLASGTFPAGDHALRWHGEDDAGSPVATGVYLARLQGLGTPQTIKLILAK